MHHMAPKAVERNLRRQKVLSWRFQKSFFEMRVIHGFSSSGYHFVKIDKNRFSLHIIGLVCRMSILLVPIDFPGPAEHFSYPLYGI